MSSPQRPWQPAPRPPLPNALDKALAEHKNHCHCDGKGCPCCDGAGGFSNMPGIPVAECGCGGPVGHVPNGILCRKAP